MHITLFPWFLMFFVVLVRLDMLKLELDPKERSSQKRTHERFRVASRLGMLYSPLLHPAQSGLVRAAPGPVSLLSIRSPLNTHLVPEVLSYPQGLMPPWKRPPADPEPFRQTLKR